MVTIDLQNKAEEPGETTNGYFVSQAEYEESDLFTKIIHAPTTPIADDIIIQNKDKRLTVIIKEKQDEQDIMYTFSVLFLKFDLENPLIIIIESEKISKFFRYSDLMGDGKPGSVKLSEIEDYHDEVSILSDLYSESFKAGKTLVYRLEMTKNYNGLKVEMDDENIESRVYVHTPEESCKERFSYISYRNKLVLTYIDDRHESGALYYVQNKVYEKIAVYNYGDTNEGNLIQFYIEGKTFSYEKEEDGKWKYREGHKLEENESTNQTENSKHLISEKELEGSGDETDETKETDSSDEIPDFLRGSFEPTDYTEEMIKNMGRKENDHDSGLPDYQLSQLDVTKSSSGLQNKQINGKNHSKGIDEGDFEDDIRAKMLTGIIIPVTIGVLLCPAYMAYEYYFKK